MNEDEAIKILKTMCTDNFCIEQLKTKQAIETILDLYQKEKEKNKKLQIRCKELIEEKQELNTALLYDNINKDKIRAKIKELEEKSDYWNCDEIEVLKELLEEN